MSQFTLKVIYNKHSNTYFSDGSCDKQSTAFQHLFPDKVCHWKEALINLAGLHSWKVKIRPIKDSELDNDDN